MGFHSCSSSSSAYFSKFKFELSNLNFSSSSLAKNIKFFEFKFRLTKILSLLFDLIALLLYTCCFFRLPRHKQMYDIFNLRGMINNQYYFFPTIFPSLNFFMNWNIFFRVQIRIRVLKNYFVEFAALYSILTHTSLQHLYERNTMNNPYIVKGNITTKHVSNGDFFIA